MTPLEGYLTQIAHQLQALSQPTRAEVLLELQQHIEDSMSETGMPADAAIARMGDPREIAPALVCANRKRALREWKYALAPYPLLLLGVLVDRFIFSGDTIAGSVLIICFAVSFYVVLTRALEWPLWSASWFGLASMLPAIMAEGSGQLSLFVFIFPCIVLRIYAEQGVIPVLLALGSIGIAIMLMILRTCRFTSYEAAFSFITLTVICVVTIVLVSKLAITPRLMRR
jgi:hypothetical protein